MICAPQMLRDDVVPVLKAEWIDPVNGAVGGIRIVLRCAIAQNRIRLSEAAKTQIGATKKAAGMVEGL